MVVIAPKVRTGGIGISWHRMCAVKMLAPNPLTISGLLKPRAAKGEHAVLVSCCVLMGWPTGVGRQVLVGRFGRQMLVKIDEHIGLA